MSGLSGIFGSSDKPVIATGQLTAYAPGDDGSTRKGTAKSYTVNNTGAYSGSTNIDVPAYAATTISFTAPNTVSDSANLLAQVKTGDTVVIIGSAGNNITDIVATGNVAGSFVLTNSLISNEAAGATVTIAKRAAMSNQTAFDNNVVVSGAKREWMSYTSNGLKIGPASTGTLVWYDTTYAYTVYSSANTISCTAPNIMKIVGGAALTQFKVGYCYQFAGFATAMNNLTGGWECTAVTVNGADLDLTFKTYDFASFTTEGAVGDTIQVVCNSIFAFCAACNAASVSGLTDWRVPNFFEIVSISDCETPNGFPNATAFPAFGLADRYVTSLTTPPGIAADCEFVDFNYSVSGSRVKTLALIALLMRGP